jgi:hypothetical protein
VLDGPENSESEASRIVKADKNNSLNMLLLAPPGGEAPTDEYLRAIRAHLARDSQVQKDGLIAAYFRVTQAPEVNRQALARDFMQAVLRTVH